MELQKSIFNMHQLSIGEMVARSARRFPEREALIFEERRFTYREFDHRTNGLACALLQRGYRRGDKIAQLMLNCSELVDIYIALGKMGGIGVPLNFRLKDKEIVYQLENSEARALFFGEEFSGVAGEIHERMPDLDYVCVGGNAPGWASKFDDLVSGGPAEAPDVAISDDDPAFIMYTSGTTGKPKGAVLTHKNQLMNAMNCIIELVNEHSLDEEERIQIPGPLFHQAALSLLLVGLTVGATLFVLRFFDPEKVVRQIAEERITSTFMAPVMAVLLLETVDVSTYDTSSLHTWVSGTSILPNEVRRRITEAFPCVKIFDVFGQTEMSPVTTILKPSQSEGRIASVGKPVFNVEVRVVDEHDQDVEAGKVGEIVYRGPTVMKEYYRDPEATMDAMRGGWFHSGDLVRMDEEGFIYVVDRKKDMIISGGENIYPAEIEAVLNEHPKIVEAAVIGVHDKVWGEAVMAVVVPAPGENLSKEEVVSWCAERLAGYKKPKHVEFVDQLPRNASLKVLKSELRRIYGRSIRYD